jgi:hypothetical protein
VPPAHFVEAQAEQGLWQELHDHDASLNRALNEALRIHSGPAWRVFQVSRVSLSSAIPPPALFHIRAFPDARSSRLACWRQELERRARERYDALDRLDADLHWYRGQYEALDALVEALWSPDRWLAYRAEALMDLPLEQGAQAVGGASAVERVRMALVERDAALHKAHEDLEGAHSVAAAWEAEVVTARAQCQRDCAALQEAGGLKTALADKAAALTAAEEQLRRERAARQEAEGQLQQERAALVEARAALERERMAREEALGQLQQDRASLEGVQATLKQREDDMLKLKEELVQISISHEDLRQSLEEQEATVLTCSTRSRRRASPSRGRRSMSKVSSLSPAFRLSICSFWDPLPTLFLFVRGFQACGPPWEHDYPGQGGADGLQPSTGVGGTAGCRPRDLPRDRGGRAQAGSSLSSRLRALGGHVSQRLRRALHLGVRKALGVVGSHYQVDFEAVSSGYVVPVGVEDEEAMNRADALAAPAANTLAEDFMEFLFLDAPGADDPQA